MPLAVGSLTFATGRLFSTTLDVLATWWALVSAAIALALAAPFLGWQTAHGWPQLALALGRRAGPRLKRAIRRTAYGG